MAFIETPRFPDNISYGGIGGPNWMTDVVIRSNGAEQRTGRWTMPLYRFDVAHAARADDTIADLIAHFYAVRGRLDGFRYKDWQDYTCLQAVGILGTGYGDGTPTYQMYKNYTSGAVTFARKIVKPVSGSDDVYRAGSPVTAGAAAGNYSLDTTTGIVTFVSDSSKNVIANSSKTITAITKANPGQVTAVAHGFSTGDKIRIASVGGMTQVNNLYFTITVVDVDNFTIGVDSTAYTTYTSGGTAIKYGITQTNLVRVHSTAHGYTNGQTIYLSSVGGMTQVNNLPFVVTNAATDYFELSGINGTAYTLYTSGAVIGKYPQPTETLAWAGEFDVPVRYDTDRMDVTTITKNVNGWQQIPLTELRL